MALNLGELYVSLSLKADTLTGGLRKAAESIDKFGKEMKKLGRDVAEASAIVSGFGALMVAEASKYDQKVASAVEGLQQQYSKLAVEVGRILVPVIKELTQALALVVDWFRSLSPEAKDSIATFAKWAAGIAAAATAVAGLGAGIEAFGGIASAALSPLALKAAAVTAALMGIVAAVGAVKNAGQGAEGGVARLGRGITRAVGGISLGAIPGLPAGLSGSVKDLYPKAIQDDLAATSGTGGSVLEGLQADAKAGLSAILGNTFDELVSKFSGLGQSASSADNKLLSLADAAKAAAAANAYAQGVETDIQDFLNREGGDRRPEVGLAASVDTSKLTAVVESQGRAAVSSLVMGNKSFLQRVQHGLQELARSMGEGLRAAGDFFGSNLGHLVQSFDAGGIAGVVVALVQHSQGFADTLAVLNGILQMLADVVGAVLTPLQPLIASLMGLVEAVAAGLQPAFDVIASVLEPFIPVIVMVGELLKVMAPALGMFLAAIQLIQNPMLLVASKAMPLLFEAVKFFGTGILKVVQWIAPVWNTIAGAVMSVVRAVINGVQTFLRSVNVGGLLTGIINSLETLKPASTAMQIDMYALAKAIQDLGSLTWDAAMAKARETAEVLKGTGAQRDAGQAATDAARNLRQLSEELTNVPTGFKVTAARYGAIDAAGGLGGAYLEQPYGNTGIVPPRIDLMDLPAAASPASAALEAAMPAPAPAPQVVVSVKLDSRELANSVATVQENKAWQRTGERRRMEAF